MASLFDASQFKMPPPRPLCCVCGGGMGRRGENPGLPAKPHDRFDQAVVYGRSNPCPGGGKPTVSSDEFYSPGKRWDA